MSRKLDNTRVVVFEEDYNPSGKKVLYKKGEKHFIHKDVAEKVAKKVKVKVSKFDEKTETEKAAKAFRESQKGENK